MSVVEFRLLGLVEIWAHGRPVPAGQPRQRLLLAALLADAGRPVTPETLVYRLWGELPPSGARHSLHEYVARIRRLLADFEADEVRLVRRGGVYVLEVDPGRVDLHRFRRLLDQARQSGRTDEERAEVLQEALALWRGEPLADLSGTWVEQVRERGRRQRVEAAVLWGQTLLRLGRAGEVIEPAAAFAVEHPLSEPVVAVVMRALYAAGRAVEALDQYTAFRKRLVEDLGTEPGAELQAVQQMILRGEADPDVDRPVPQSAPPALDPDEAVPAQLPVSVRGFAGRDRELSRMDSVLAETGGHGGTVIICAVSGTAGVGKTALAVHWAHRHRAHFPDGQLYVNLRGFDPAGSVMTTAEAVRGFLDALAVPPGRIPTDLGAQTALYRSLLSGKRMLVVLDNARDPEQIRPLLPGSSGCLALVTSRRQLTSLVALDGAELVLLDVLTLEEARALLAHRLGAARVGAEPDAVDAIVNRCVRLPLALAVAAARAATRPVTPLAELARELGEVGQRLDTLSAGDAVSDVRAVFSWSYHALSPAAAELFRLLGLHPGPDLSLPAAASLAGLSRADVVPPLAELLEAHLLTEHTPGRYSFHDLLRAYATELSQDVDSPERRRIGLHRLLDHYVHTAHVANRLLTPARDNVTPEPEQAGVTPESPADYDAALAWFTKEHHVLLAALDHAASSGFDTHTWQLSYHLVTYLRRQGHRHDYATSQRTAVAAAARLDQPAVQALAQRMLGDAYRMLGRLDDAEEQLQQALALAARAGDVTGQAQTHQLLNIVREIQGRYADALGHAQQALDLYEAAGERGGQANALNAVGWCHTLLGDYQRALDPCERALALFQEVGDRAGEAYTWDSLGYAHHHLGHHGEAVACYRQAIDLLRQLGARYDEAYALEHLGDTQHAAGDVRAARAGYEQALTILDGLSHPKAGKLREKLEGLDR